MKAANKLMDLVKQESDQKRIDVFKQHLNSCLGSAGFLKATISDKKRALGSQSHVMAKSNAKVGLGCLGAQYLYAHDYYTQLGDYYFTMATQKGFAGILPTVKKCFTIAAVNIQ